MRKLTGPLLAFLVGVAPIALTEAPAQAQAAIRIQVAPPALRTEVIPRAPSPRHVWVAGHWGWNGSKHVWVGGYHALPPHPGYHWNPAHWTNEGGAWAFQQGNWSPPYETVAVAPAEEAVIETAPPPPVEEVVPPSPGPGQVWIPGFHRWDPAARRHVWVAGRYEAGRPGHHWAPSHWVRTHRGYEFAPGHWR